jgi:hypothetical protein
MGQSESTTSCVGGCFDSAMTMGEDPAAKERINALKAGQKFMRSSFLGMAQREVILNLSEDTAKIEFKSPKTTWSAEERGEIDLTTDVKAVRIAGLSGLQFLGKEDDKEKILLEVSAEDPKIRDQWVISLNDMLQDWNLHPDKKPKSSLTAAGTTDKDAYFARRQEEMKEREKKAKELKGKYTPGGMKHTAQIMASRA